MHAESDTGEDGTRRFTSAAFALGGATAGLGALALFGWASGLRLAASLGGRFIPMAPNTAVAFLLGGTALAYRARRGPTRVAQISACIASAIVAAIALAALAFPGTSFPVSVPPSAPDAAAAPHPLGVMSPVTAVTFLVAAAALAAHGVRSARVRRAGAPLACFVGGIGTLVVITYAFGTPLFQDVATLIPVAATTGLAFAALGGGLVVLDGPSRWPLRLVLEPTVRALLLRTFLPVTVIAVLLEGWATIFVSTIHQPNPAVLAAVLAGASLAVVAVVVARVARTIGAQIEASEASRLRAEDERAQSEERVRMAQVIAQHREQLSALLVHDLKNPLAAIVANVSFLRDDFEHDDDSREALEDVLAIAETMQRMLLNLLDISRAEDGQLTAKLVDIDLASLLERVTRAVAPRASRRNQRMLVRTTDLGQRVLRADPELLERVLENLIDNSLTHAGDGHIEIEARTRGTEHVEIAVRDQGPGVPGELKQKIFEKYAQVAPGNVRPRAGRGLGLFFCRIAVEALGGRIWVEDNQPKGSVFAFTIPIATGPATGAG